MTKGVFILFTAVLLLLVLASRCKAIGGNKLSTLYSWKSVDYAFPDDAPPQFFLRSGEFIQNNQIILDASVWEQGESSKVFVTTPRLRKGTPATLSIVSPKRRNNQNLLQPYPDWSWHRQNLEIDERNWNWGSIDCDKMISVFRTTLDSCGRLWVLDTGFLHAINKQVCQPKILLFDVQTDKLVGKYVFPKDVASKTSLLITIVVDIRNNKCDDVFAYIADVIDFKLVIYDHKRKSSWNIESNLFYPYPLEGVFHISGVEFDLMDGIFGLALGPVENNDRVLYFHSLASVMESYVSTSVIRDHSLFKDGENKRPRSFNVFNESRGSQSAAQASSKDGVLFFGLLSQNSIACWNVKQPYTQTNIETVAHDDERLQFTSGMKVNNGKLYATTCRFQNFFTGVMNYNETNFRILVAPVDDLIRATSCSGKLLSPPWYTTFRPSFQESTPFNLVYRPPYSNRRTWPSQ